MIFTTGRSYEDTHGMNTPVLVFATIFFMGSAFVTGLTHEAASKSIPRFFRWYRIFAAKGSSTA